MHLLSSLFAVQIAVLLPAIFLFLMSHYVELANWLVLYNIIPSCRYPIFFGCLSPVLIVGCSKCCVLTVVSGFWVPRRKFCPIFVSRSGSPGLQAFSGLSIQISASIYIHIRSTPRFGNMLSAKSIPSS